MPTAEQLAEKIRSLAIPDRAKAILGEISRRSTKLGSWLIDFIKEHPSGSQAVGLTCAIVFLLHHLSIIAGSLLCLGGIIVLLQELKNTLRG